MLADSQAFVEHVAPQQVVSVFAHNAAEQMKRARIISWTAFRPADLNGVLEHCNCLFIICMDDEKNCQVSQVDGLPGAVFQLAIDFECLLEMSARAWFALGMQDLSEIVEHPGYPSSIAIFPSRFQGSAI